jgi:hypothetical protein
MKVWLFPLALVVMLLAAALPVYPAAPGRLVLVSKLDGPPLPADLRIVEDYGAFVLAEVPEADLPTLQAEYVVDPLPERTVISLNGTVWDTQVGEPAIQNELRSAPDDPYFLVQFYGPVKDEWMTNLEALGVEFLGYHPNFTYIVRMDPALVLEVEKAHAVEWVGAYHLAYRLASAQEMALALTDGDKLALNVRGFVGDEAGALERSLEGAGVTIEWLISRDPPAARIWAAAEQLPAIAALGGIYRVEPYVPHELDNDRAVQVTHTWDVWRQGRNGLLQDLMGQGQIAGMVDSGLDDNDTTPLINDFYDWTNGIQTTRIQAAIPGSGCGTGCSCYTEDHANSSGHGTHVAGSIVANGYNALLQRGLQSQARGADPYFDYAWGVGQAPEAKIAFAYVAGRSGPTQGTLCGIGDAYTTWGNVYNQGARNVNNSWGAPYYSYTADAVDADQVMWQNQDYLVLSSASNDGPGWNTVAEPGTAKNILTVGAAGNHRSVWANSSDTSSLLTDFSSRGPVNLSGGDGRFKPDIVAPGADILSTRSTFILNSELTLWMNEPGDGDGDGHQDYWWSGGTSMSSPHVTGAATIVRQYFQDIQGLGSTTPPSAALIKAALVNGAVDMGYGYESFTSAPYGGRNLQGWGMVNVEQSITPRAPRSFFYDDFTNISGSTHQSGIGPNSTGDYVEYTVSVVDSGEPLKVTLNWTDQQDGNDGIAVNNLDLLVTSPGSTAYRGNVFSGSWSTPGGSADTKNPTEAVYIQSPASGTWTIRVTMTSWGGNAGTYQPYALLVSGGLGVTPSYARTCSGIASCTGRLGTSAQDYHPSLKPLTGTEEHTPAGGSFTTSFRVTNWGTLADTIGLSSAATNMIGDSVSGVTVSFDDDSLALASGASQDVVATVSIGSGVATGSYDLSLVATSGGTGNRADVQVIGLNVLPDTDLSNETRVVLDGGAQFSHSFWGTGSNLWTAYLSAQGHNNGEAEVYAARSTDGGQSWTSMGQVDAGNERYILQPAIAGSASGNSVTVVWIEESSTSSSGAYPTYSYYVYARTWTSVGGWGTIRQLAAYLNNANYYINDPAVVYDNDGHALAVWLYYDGTTSTGLRSSFSTNDGGTWSTPAAIPDTSGGTYRWASLTLDSRNNHVWMAYAAPVSGANRDVRAKYWNGNTNSWPSGTIAVATTANRESRPAITYVRGESAALDALWISWVRYLDWTDVTPRLYYARSSGTLPGVTFPTTYGPYATRVAEIAPGVTGDATNTYIAYLAYTDSFRGGNVYMLRVPAAGGIPAETYQLSATVDDPPLYARGNAGIPRLLWLNTTVNGLPYTGPTLLYSKNPPDSEDPDYSTNLGVAQTLYNREENVDLYLSQAGNSLPTAVKLVRFEVWPAGAALHVEWETASELDNLGFNLYRSDAPGGDYIRLNDTLIPSQSPGSPAGAVYTWLDEEVEPGTTYYYKLEDVDVHGASTLHDPVGALVAQPTYPVYLPLVTK